DPRASQLTRILDSATYLSEHLHEVPVHVIPCVEGRVEQAGPPPPAAGYGPVPPPAWGVLPGAPPPWARPPRAVPPHTSLAGGRRVAARDPADGDAGSAAARRVLYRRRLQAGEAPAGGAADPLERLGTPARLTVTARSRTPAAADPATAAPPPAAPRCG